MNKTLYCIAMLFVLLWITASYSSTSAAQETVHEAEPQLSWETVIASNDIYTYARYLKDNPQATNREELRQLIDKFFAQKVNEVEKTGKQIIHNAKKIEARYAGSVIFGPGSSLRISGGGITLGGFEILSDPLDSVTIVFEADGAQTILQGRGMAIKSDIVYCFGF